uniref:Charged multivesicular body protein 7 n=1 Tax=Leptobrachium leishanense TaxID=445787 RepID=A0A8C5QWF8_9ANUR
MAPVNPYPPEWDDDERMSFLFSAFKQSRDVNTADWDSKMAFWVPTILQYAQSQGLVSVALHQLQTEFTRKGSVPLGLPIVMQEMVRQGSLQRESDFVAGVTSGWLSWGMSQLVIRPLRWTAGKILGVQISPDEAFVVPEVLKKWAELLLMQYRSSSLNSSPVLHEKDVRMLWAEICPKSASLNLVLLQLQRDKRICMMERSGEKLVKFVQEGMSLTPIGEADVGILELRKCEKLLSSLFLIPGISHFCDLDINCMYPFFFSFSQALRCMRRRKLAEHRVSELQNKVDTVQNILERISTAETDRKVVTAYEGGVSALRLAMKDVSVDKAESLVDQIQEFCDLQDDISQTLTGMSVGDTGMLLICFSMILRTVVYNILVNTCCFSDIDPDDLERELDDILKTENVLDELPDVPTNPIISSPQKITAPSEREATFLFQTVPPPISHTLSGLYPFPPVSKESLANNPFINK